MRFRKRIKDINIDLNINTRPLDPGVIEEYAESMEGYGVDKWQSAWKEMPKITHNLDLFSGFHTVHAAMQAFGEEHEITFDVEGNTLRDAFFLATEQNAQHGRRRGNAEKRNVVLRWLLDDEMKEWTDGYIAEQCQVSQNFVTSVSNQLKSDLSGTDLPTLVFSDGKRKSITEYHRPSKRKFMGKGGVQWIETDKIGTTAAETPSDYEHKNAHDFAEAKCDEAIRTYEEKQESIGLSELPWYGRGGFFYYAQAELEKQGKKLGYASHTDTVNRLSELAKLWESVTNAIKHNANWIKAVVGKEERKAERKRQESIKECRKLVKETKQRFHVAREKLGFPDLEWEHFITSYAQKQFEDPLFPHVFENVPLDALRNRCRVWESIKSALSPTKPTIWVHEIPEYRKVYEEAVDAAHAAQDTYDAVKKELGFTGLPWHRPNQPTHEKRCFRAYAIMEGKMLGLVDPAMDVSIDFLKKLVDLWQTVKQDLETPAEWVKTAAWQYKATLVEEDEEADEANEGKERVEATETAQASMDAAKESFLENREVLGLAGVDWEDFAERARIEFKRRKADNLRAPSNMDQPAKLSYLASLWERLRKLTLPPAQDWVAEYADEVKRSELFGEVVTLQNQAQAIWQEDLRGHVYWDAFNEAIAANIDRKLGEPITAAASVEELTKHIELRKRALAELKAPADWVIALKERGQARSEPEQPTPLEIEPLGEVTESTPQSPDDSPLAEILNTESYSHAHLVDCKQRIGAFIELEGIPLMLKFAAEEFLETIEKSVLQSGE